MESPIWMHALISASIGDATVCISTCLESEIDIGRAVSTGRREVMRRASVGCAVGVLVSIGEALMSRL